VDIRVFDRTVSELALMMEQLGGSFVSCDEDEDDDQERLRLDSDLTCFD
jgi:hypothetical protein